ncbi:UNVERIFIED_CONTAM: phosphoglycolate phosphatase [Acetivibrio alkalicellulosi]
MAKTLLFDFDGTLVNTKDIAVQIYNDLAEEYNYKKINASDISGISKASIIERCKLLNIPKFKIPFLLYEATKKFKNHTLTINLFEGIKEVLNTLYNENFNLVIISSNTEDIIKEVLLKNGIYAFSNIYSSKNLFGKHITINNYIKKNNLKKEDVIYVGDELRDIVSCKKCGVRIISVTWGFDSPELLMNNNPDYLANTPEQIIDIARSM